MLAGLKVGFSSGPTEVLHHLLSQSRPNLPSLYKVLTSLMNSSHSLPIHQLLPLLSYLHIHKTSGPTIDFTRSFLTRYEPSMHSTDTRTLTQLLNKAYLLLRENHPAFTTGFHTLAERIQEVDIRGKVTLMHLLAKLEKNKEELVGKLREGLGRDLEEGRMDAHQIAVYLSAFFHLVSNCSSSEQRLIETSIRENCWSFYPKHILVLISYCPPVLMPTLHPLLLPPLQFIVKHDLVTPGNVHKS